ncbi:MAG: hypothetical protein WKF87_21780 [Chryseolinea sp.]
MKNKVVLGLSALLVTSAAFGQGIESDDMYFSSKDRAKLKEAQASKQAAYEASARNTKRDNIAAVEEDDNAEAIYSARNENPEFAARSNSQSAQADNQDYFVNDYKYNNYSNLNNFNNNFNDWYGSSWYRSNYYNPSIYGWNSPYYGSAYDSWGNPWMNPYYRSGWSSSFSFHLGNSWNYGWGNNMGWGMSYGYNNPYMGSMYGYRSGYGYGAGYGGWYNSPTVIIVNNGEGGRNVAYGKRGSHGGMVTSAPGNGNSRSRNSNIVEPSAGGVRPTYGNSGGRIATTAPTRSSRQEEYYNRSWRSSQQPATSSGSYNAPSRNSSSDSWNRSSNSDFGRTSSPNNNNNGGNVRSGSSDGGAVRSSAPASSGSNGRTRGRD